MQFNRDQLHLKTLWQSKTYLEENDNKATYLEENVNTTDKSRYDVPVTKADISVTSHKSDLLW